MNPPTLSKSTNIAIIFHLFPIVFSERSPRLPLHQVHALPRGQARHPGEVGQARRTQDQDVRLHLEPGEKYL